MGGGGGWMAATETTIASSPGHLGSVAEGWEQPTQIWVFSQGLDGVSADLAGHPEKGGAWSRLLLMGRARMPGQMCCCVPGPAPSSICPGSRMWAAGLRLDGRVSQSPSSSNSACFA